MLLSCNGKTVYEEFVLGFDGQTWCQVNTWKSLVSMGRLSQNWSERNRLGRRRQN